MSAAIAVPVAVAEAGPQRHPEAAARAVRLTLLGTGTVGTAFVRRWQRLREQGLAVPDLAWLVNSRVALPCRDDVPGALETARRYGRGTPSCLDLTHQKAGRREFAFEALRSGDIIIDATASEVIAAAHAQWLQCGVHVVTANKLGLGADSARAQRILQAQGAGAACYGDSATIGAGLPLIRSIRELRRGGDRIHAVEGILSGSLAWLLHQYDGIRPFSDAVRAARAAGYTEPDPRIDLSGADVCRKLLILARAAGLALEAANIQVESLVPPALAAAPRDQIDAFLPALDPDLRQRWQQAHAQCSRLRFVGRFQVESNGQISAYAGVRALPSQHPLCGGSGTDNRVAITSDRYRERPLIIQGPGAGAGVTAAALLDDVLSIAC